MNRAEIIRRAKEIFINDRGYTAMIKLNGFARVPVLDDGPVSFGGPEIPNTRGSAAIVTFTEEEHAVLGFRLMAEYEGIKEFAA